MIEFYTLILKNGYNTFFGLLLTFVIFYGSNEIAITTLDGLRKIIRKD